MAIQADKGPIEWLAALEGKERDVAEGNEVVGHFAQQFNQFHVAAFVEIGAQGERGREEHDRLGIAEWRWGDEAGRWLRLTDGCHKERIAPVYQNLGYLLSLLRPAEGRNAGLVQGDEAAQPTVKGIADAAVEWEFVAAADLESRRVNLNGEAVGRRFAHGILGRWRVATRQTP